MVIRSLAQTVGLLPRDNHQRLTRKVATQIKNDITSFYCRDDVSHQMPGKHDTVVLKENGNKLTYQKRILLLYLRLLLDVYITVFYHRVHP
jgi:hypothetical protein